MRKIARRFTMLGGLFALALTLGVARIAGAQGAKPLKKCPVDAVVSGTVCMDAYEASVWRVPDATGANKSLANKIRQGRATAEALTAGGATQLGTASDDYAPCADSGQNCTNDIFAASLSGVLPSSRITWFQAQQACKNARKRLPSNAEWQAAVAGTPDPGSDNGTTDCNTASAGTGVATGSRSGCVSSDGAFDMVGNVFEWVADWVPQSTSCPGWVGFANDLMCLVGASTTAVSPGALRRGGYFLNGALAGPLTVDGRRDPTDWDSSVGFRCAR